MSLLAMLRSAQTLQEQAQAVFLNGTPKYGAINEHPSKPNFDLSKNYKNIKRLKKKHKGEAEKPLHKTEHKEQLNTTMKQCRSKDEFATLPLDR
jgi:hypothetical protein